MNIEPKPVKRTASHARASEARKIAAGAKVSNLGDVRWHATEDGSVGKGTGRHIACFVLDGAKEASNT